MENKNIYDYLEKKVFSYEGASIIHNYVRAKHNESLGILENKDKSTIPNSEKFFERIINDNSLSNGDKTKVRSVIDSFIKAEMDARVTMYKSIQASIPKDKMTVTELKDHLQGIQDGWSKRVS